MICCPVGVFNVVQEENIAKGVVLLLDEGEEHRVGAGDSENMVEDIRAVEEGDPGPADEEPPLEVGGGGGGNEEPGRLGCVLRRRT